jgi:magnesium transporter
MQVLEVCLDYIANYMAALVTDLEKLAYPALDSLTHRVTPNNLERVRRVKNRMVRLNTRVETIRQLLEKYLDDDEDMQDLNLTGKR